MQTAQQLREAAQSQRMRAYAAPNMEMQRLELIEAERLEKQAAELGQGQGQARLDAMDAELRQANAAMRRAKSRVSELETMLAGLLGLPIADRSPVWIAGRLNEWRKS